MASLGRTFDANTVAPREVMEALAPGKYHGHIIASEWKPTSSGTGRFLEFQLEVLSGPSANRKAWDRLNLDNPNAQAVEIAERTLSAVCHATGQLLVNDTDPLHFKPLVFTMGWQKGSNTQTEVKGYEPYTGTTPAAGTSPPRTTPPRQPATAAAPQYGNTQQPAKPVYGHPASGYGQQQPAYGGAPQQQQPAQQQMPPPATQAAAGNGPWARG